MTLHDAPPAPRTPWDPASFEALLSSIADGAAERERTRIHPFAAVRALGDAGFGTLRVPVAHGGPGSTLRELFAFVVRLAAADPNVAQSLRAHFHFVEGRLAAGDGRERERWFPEVLRGALVGNATVERTSKDIFAFETTLRPDGDGFRLDGTKYYSTGSLHADYVAVTAVLADGGGVVSAVVPVDREGVELVDDWDGMGQRLTASGTSRFTAVRVAPDEVLVSPIGRPAAAPRSAFLQLYLVAVQAGIVANVATDAAAMVRGRTRTVSHAGADTPAGDPLVQQVVGRISADAFAAESVVLAAATALDAASGGDADAAHHAAVLTAQAQVVLAELAPRSAELLFSAGGASATSREANLDRHWRNARTLASHNPAMHKARALGDLLINHVRLPANGWF